MCVNVHIFSYIITLFSQNVCFLTMYVKKNIKSLRGPREGFYIMYFRIASGNFLYLNPSEESRSCRTPLFYRSAQINGRRDGMLLLHIPVKLFGVKARIQHRRGVMAGYAVLCYYCCYGCL